MRTILKISGLLVLACIACTPLATTSSVSSGPAKILKLNDYAYEDQIKTVRLFPRGQPLAPAVTQLGNVNLMLEFDDLQTERQNYMVRVVHCNFDWTKSVLQNLDFIEGYNEFPINN